MKKILLLATILLLTTVEPVKSEIQGCSTHTHIENPENPEQLAELDKRWAKLAKTVEEGDFEGYKALYHPDAVVVFAGGENKISVPISKALASWEKGFNNTRDGKQKDTVEFRFSQRIVNETTAHETGIFIFTSMDNNGKVKAKYVTHFEMVWVKKEGNWYALTEYQKSDATQEEWDALK